MKINYVRQKHRSGCAVACIAMVTGIPYEQVDKHFQTNFQHDGLKPEITRMFVCDQGFSSIEAISHGYHSLSDSNKRMARPFADVHIVSVQPFADSEINHAVVMDKRGRVYDPDRPDIKNLSAYYYIVRVSGFWRD